MAESSWTAGIMKGSSLLILFYHDPVYAVENTYGEYEIIIVHRVRTRNKTTTCHNKVPPGHIPTCLCVNMYVGDRIAVTSKDHTLDIYYNNGR